MYQGKKKLNPPRFESNSIRPKPSALCSAFRTSHEFIEEVVNILSCVRDLVDVTTSVWKWWRDCVWISFKPQICHLILRKEVAPHLIAIVSSSWHDSQILFRDGITWFFYACSSCQDLCNCSQGRSEGAENISREYKHSPATQQGIRTAMETSLAEGEFTG